MAKDIFHQIAKEILVIEGWNVTHDPLYLKSGGINVEIDLAAERVIAAEKDNEKIAIEIKSFLGKSKINDFYEAKGQYDVYREMLLNEKNPRHLYLGIEEDIYKTFFQRSIIQTIIKKDAISLWVFNPQTKCSVLWIK